MGSEGTAAPRAGRGSVAGAAGDAGVEYRRAVAAHAVACGLAGVPLLGVGVPAADAHVDAVVLETEDPVDDIKVCFKSGWTAFLQAKRSLGKGSALTAAVAQWVKAASGPLDPKTQRLVIVTGSISGSMKTLQRALERHKADIVGPPTDGEAAALKYLDGLLVGLNDEQRTL